jgi:hypothetical protein
MPKIEEVKPNLFVVEKINKKSKKVSYRQVYPIIKDITKPFGKGNINWKNLFRVDFGIIIILFLVAFSIWAYYHDLRAYRTMLNDECIVSCSQSCHIQNKLNLNLSQLNITKEENDTPKLPSTSIYNQSI